ncbi:MAG TPA: N-acetylmuramoyl-L-alanine amidase [Capillibacterium sp.]
MKATANWKRRLNLGFSLLLLLIFFTGTEIGSPGGTGSIQVKAAGKGNILLGLNCENNQGKYSYNLLINGDYTYRSFLLAEPDRLVIDLTGVELDPALSTEGLAGGPVKGIRVSRFDQDTVRVVFDLEYLVGYKLERLTTSPAGLRLDFNVVLKDVGFQSASATPEIYVESTGPVQYKTDYLLDPHRLVIDLWDVTLRGPALTIPGNGQWVSSIRVSQFNPQTIRLVLEINEPRNCVVAIDETNPGRLVIRTIPELVEAAWVPEGSGGKLVLKGTGALQGNVRSDPEKGKLYVELPDTKLGAGFQAPATEEPVVQIREKIPSTVEVELAVPRSYQYRLLWTQDRKEMTVQLQNAPLAGKVIILDPGHGGADAGAISTGGLREKELNLVVALRLKAKLEALGAEVLLTREDDRYLWLYDRVAIANRAGGSVLLSIHANNHDNKKINGLEIWHHPEREESAALAAVLARTVLDRTKQHFRGSMASKEFVLPREAEMPAVIFEMGFISNPEEEKLLKTEEFQEKIAEGLCQGLLDYFQVSTAK